MDKKFYLDDKGLDRVISKLKTYIDSTKDPKTWDFDTIINMLKKEGFVIEGDNVSKLKNDCEYLTKTTLGNAFLPIYSDRLPDENKLEDNHVYTLTEKYQPFKELNLRLKDENKLGIVVYFNTHESGCTLSLPEGKWIGDSSVKENKKYVLTIVDGTYHLDEYTIK